jgi:hypothetical protein
MNVVRSSKLTGADAPTFTAEQLVAFLASYENHRKANKMGGGFEALRILSTRFLTRCGTLAVLTMMFATMTFMINLSANLFRNPEFLKTTCILASIMTQKGC